MENLFGILLSLSFSIAYIPQILKMVKRKKSNDVSLIMLIVNGIGYSSGVLYVVMKQLDAFWLKFNYIAGFIMTVLCILTWYIYKERSND